MTEKPLHMIAKELQRPLVVVILTTSFCGAALMGNELAANLLHDSFLLVIGYLFGERTALKANGRIN